MISDHAVLHLPTFVSTEDINMANSTGLEFSAADFLATRGENPHDMWVLLCNATFTNFILEGKWDTLGALGRQWPNPWRWNWLP